MKRRTFLILPVGVFLSARTVGASNDLPTGVGVGADVGLQGSAFEDHKHQLFSEWEDLTPNTGTATPCRVSKAGDLVLLQFNLTGTPDGSNLISLPSAYIPESYRFMSGLFWGAGASNPTDVAIIIDTNGLVFGWFNNSLDSVVRDRYHLAGAMYRASD